MNSRIGIIGENSIEFIEILLDIWKNQNIACVFDWRIPLSEIEFRIKEADIKLCYIQKNILNKSISVCEYKEYEVKDSSFSFVPQYIYDNFTNNYSKSEAIILYSSGTTGVAKGIKLSHYAINKNADMIHECLNSKKDECVFLAKPMSHSSGLVTGLIHSLKYKVQLVVCNPTQSPTKNLYNIFNSNATTLLINPSLLKLFVLAQKKLNLNFHKLRIIRVSGSAITTELVNEAKACFGESIKILNGYGLTETGPAITMQNMEENSNGYVSVGKQLNGVELKIDIIENDIGKILVKTPCLFIGYVSIGEDFEFQNGEWYNTGDIGRIDKEGNLFILGRQDNMFTVGGLNVYPEDIEKKLQEKIPQIEECVMISNKNDLFGNKITLYYSSSYKCDLNNKIREFCSDNLASYERPINIIKINSLPRNSNCKISRKADDYKKYE